MNLEPRLRRALRHEASQTETTLHPDDIVRKARRRHRGIMGASSAGAAVALVLALIIGLPMLLPSRGPTADSAPVASNPTPTSSDTVQGKVTLRFEVRVTTNPLEVRGTTQANATTFFAAVLPVSKYEGSGTVPEPRPGSGYIVDKLSDKDGDGTYRARIMLEPGRYFAAIFSGVGVVNTPDGALPGRPITLTSQHSKAFRDGLITLTRDRTISITYQSPSPSGPKESGPGEKKSAKSNHANTGTAPSGEFTLAPKTASGTASSRYPAVLSEVRVLHRPESAVIRLRFQADSGVPSYRVGYRQLPPRLEGPGGPANPTGGAAVRVLLSNARLGGEFGVLPIVPRSGLIEQIKLLRFSEGHVKLGIGLTEPAGRRPFRVWMGPHSITIQIRSRTG